MRSVTIQTFYRKKSDCAVEQIRVEIGDDIPIRIHKLDGALFLWLWFEGHPISSRELYQRLKQKGVLVVSGHYFFPGMEQDNWSHKDECIRVTYAQNDEVGERGLSLIASEIREIYTVS